MLSNMYHALEIGKSDILTQTDGINLYFHSVTVPSRPQSLLLGLLLPSLGCSLGFLGFWVFRGISAIVGGSSGILGAINTWSRSPVRLPSCFFLLKLFDRGG